MEFLNLTLLQFAATFGAVAAFSIALYLLDRNRRRQVVSTLRFWADPGKAAPVTRRSRIQQPLSLLLQLLGMLFLILALAEFQFGSSRSARRDHVLVLDTSAWMGASLPNRPNATLMDIARASALGWLRAVPASDRVLVVRADALATPATAWETDRRAIARAILDSQPGATALNLSQSLQFASQLQRGSGSLPGEIVYDGPARISAHEANNLAIPKMPAFRVLAIDDNIENAGLRSVGARRSAQNKSSDATGTWDILVRVRNYGRAPKLVNVTLNFGNIPQGARPVELASGEEKDVPFNVHTLAAGLLEARLYPKDAFPLDNYAALELPEMRSLHVIVYSDQPEGLRPALASDSRVSAEFRPTSQYTPDSGNALIVLHHFRPATRPKGNVLWIDPPPDTPPVAIQVRVDHPEGLRWIPDQPLTAGLRARDVQIDGASVFAPSPKDIRLAEISAGAIMVASVSDDGKSHTIVMGFDPFSGAMRYELTTPLLLANILRWVAPDVFRDVDVGTQSAGAVSTPLPNGGQAGAVQILTEAGDTLPFNVRDKAVEFFSGQSSRVRVLTGNSERVFSLTLPEMWDLKWTAPAGVRKGIPAWNDSIRRNRDWWPWLAILGAAILIAEWIAYGRYSPARLRVVKQPLGRAA